MQYRNRNDGTLLTQRQIVARNPNTSLPKVWTEGTYDFLEVDPVMSTQAPEVGPYEVAVRDGAAQDGDKWVEAWKVEPMFVEYETPVDGNDADLGSTVVTVDEQIADYEAKKLQQKREGMTATNENLRVALNDAGVYQTLTASKAFIENPELDIRFNFAVVINRLDEWFLQATEGLMTDEQLDALFEASVGL
jgi:hypothetical protein